MSTGEIFFLQADILNLHKCMHTTGSYVPTCDLMPYS